eukprot:scaffold50050_cov33-Tisochrysis_lutea.AAC.1
MPALRKSATCYVLKFLAELVGAISRDQNLSRVNQGQGPEALLEMKYEIGIEVYLRPLACSGARLSRRRPLIRSSLIDLVPTLVGRERDDYFHRNVEVFVLFGFQVVVSEG